MFPRLLLRRSLLLPAAGLGLAASATRYYLTHPKRAVVDLPEDLARHAEEVWLAAEDGVRLHGVWLAGREGMCDRTIIHYHGYNSSGGLVLARRLIIPPAVQRSPLRWIAETRLSALAGGDRAPVTGWPLVRAGLARGYNFLLADQRGHGRSEGPWDTRGRSQMSDLMGWVRWARQEHGQLWVGLWGNSIGASVGLWLATRPAGGGLDAMVLDSPAISPRGLYSGRIRPPVYWAVQPVIRALASRDLQQALTTTSVMMPILLIHGMEDTHVPSWQSTQAYQAIWQADAPDRADLWLVPGADHLAALEAAPDMYVQKTLDWFDRWFGPSPTGESG
jgi:alpha-beta hydrolase superfamily lysophospholipase